MMIFLLAAAAVAQSPAQPPKLIVVGQPVANATCPIAAAHMTSGRIEGTTAKGFHSLDREPAPRAYLTVARKIEGCDVPMVVPSVLTAGR